ncbi:MAG: hypothetical protein QW692_05370 [Nitrososphaerota archaeon]
MMLSERIAYLYQAAVISFAISMVLNLQPIAALTLYLMIFITVYTALASRFLKSISAQLFSSSITVSPNPSRVGDKIKIRAIVTSTKKDIPAIIKLGLKELNIVDGSNTWSGFLREGGVLLDFVASSEDPGIKIVGPLKIAVMDPLRVIVRELEIHHGIPVFVLETDEVPIQPSAYSSSAHPTPGFSRDQFIGIDYEYRTSLPQQAEHSARMIDWRRTAQITDEKIYVKFYDKLVRGDFAFGIGSGLEIILPGGMRISSKIIQDILMVLLPHLQEGSRVWLMKWSEDDGFLTSLLEKSRIIEVTHIPRMKLMIHITRLTNEKELAALRELNSRGIAIKLILVNLGEDLLRIRDTKWIRNVVDIEKRRLEDKVRILRVPYIMTSLEDFSETLRRILAYRRLM